MKSIYDILFGKPALIPKIQLFLYFDLKSILHNVI